MFKYFGQNIAEFYDKHILLTLHCTFWPEYAGKNHATWHYIYWIKTEKSFNTSPLRFEIV